MPKAYWISAYKEVTDPDKLKAYAEAATGAVQAGGGQFIARGGRVAVMEGAERPRAVVVEFPSFEAAVDTYNGDAYQAAHAKLDGGADRDLFIVEAPDD